VSSRRNAVCCGISSEIKTGGASRREDETPFGIAGFIGFEPVGCEESSVAGISVVFMGIGTIAV
jgi:hypothetical protein